MINKLYLQILSSKRVSGLVLANPELKRTFSTLAAGPALGNKPEV
jgi:hypothetical protein